MDRQITQKVDRKTETRRKSSGAKAIVTTGEQLGIYTSCELYCLRLNRRKAVYDNDGTGAAIHWPSGKAMVRNGC
jgi:hypothetical protein